MDDTSEDEKALEESLRNTSLMSDCGCLETFKLLVSIGARLEAEDDIGFTPLCTAAYSGNTRIVKYLVELGVNINHKTKPGPTPLYLAAARGKVQTARTLLELGASTDGHMLAATKAGHTNALRTLSQIGLDARAVRTGQRWTLLHWAAYMGHLSACVWLVESAGIDMEARNCYGRTALHNAASQGHLSVVNYLVSRGADLRCRDRDFRTPLYFAWTSRHSKVAEWISSHGGDI